MYRTVLNTICLSATLVLSACDKQAEDTGSTDGSVTNEDLPIDEPEAGAEEESNSDDNQEGDGSGSSPGTEPPASEDDESTEGEPLEDDLTETPDNGAYAGNMTIIINTSFGPDTCAGSASVNVTEDGMMNGTGTCSFGILGAQSPTLSGTVAEDGSVTATVDLSAFGTSFTLDWTGFRDDTSLVASYNGTDSLVGVGSITYEVVVNFEVDTAESAGETSSLSEFIDYGDSGEFRVFQTAGTYTSTDGCTMNYDVYAPEEEITDTLTVIQHGFARSRNEFVDFAIHLASWGMPAVVMDLCHAWALDVDLNQNGADVVDLVNNIWDGPVIYMGHSNGAISSLVSASLDDKAVAVLGLDPVERVGGNHIDIAGALRIPAMGIFGEAGVCNTWNSGMDAYMAVSDRNLIRSTEADHCDFEAPTGTVCTLTCSGSNDFFTDDTIRSYILGLSTAFVSWHAVGDEDAMEWADSAGGARAALESIGAVTGL